MNCVKLKSLSSVRLSELARSKIGMVVAFGDCSVQEENECDPSSKQGHR